MLAPTAASPPTCPVASSATTRSGHSAARGLPPPFGTKRRAFCFMRHQQHRRSHWPEKTDSIQARPRLNTLSLGLAIANAIALVASQDGEFTVFAWSSMHNMVHAHRLEALLN